MAPVSKSTELGTGVEAAYWKIKKLSVDTKNKKIVSEFFLYLDADAYTDGKDPLSSVQASADYTNADTAEVSAINVLSAFMELKAIEAGQPLESGVII